MQPRQLVQIPRKRMPRPFLQLIAAETRHFNNSLWLDISAQRRHYNNDLFFNVTMCDTESLHSM